jgi:hypothetical protein
MTIWMKMKGSINIRMCWILCVSSTICFEELDCVDISHINHWWIGGDAFNNGTALVGNN